jgi:hypothetical protein
MTRVYCYQLAINYKDIYGRPPLCHRPTALYMLGSSMKPCVFFTQARLVIEVGLKWFVLTYVQALNKNSFTCFSTLYAQ